MNAKIMWITFWTTLALWMGDITGNASAQKSPAAAAPGGSVACPVTHPTDSAPTTRPMNCPVVCPMPQESSVSQPADAPPPPASMLDRRNWPKIDIRPADGRTAHFPVYFQDCPITQPEMTVYTPNTPEVSLDEAMAGDRNAGYSAENSLGLIVQPLKFFADIPLLPVRALWQQPWSATTTPK